ncbi:hypothetical protein LZ30DRAFT_770757 [Colletotrichum cereale]|nr:hypothetical protein LZ30DRAFT_770757 [Colletotrichum cereale]
MRHSYLLLFFTLLYGAFATARLPSVTSSNRLLSRGSPPLMKTCPYHCGQGLTTRCFIMIDRWGEYICKDAPRSSLSVKSYKYLAKVADGAGVKLSPDTYYYFRSCAKAKYYYQDNVVDWVAQETGGCTHIALVVGKTSADNTEFEASYIDSSHDDDDRWTIKVKEWGGPWSRQTVSYGGMIPPEKAEMARILSQAAEWKKRSEERYDTEYNCLTLYDELVAALQ